MTHDDSLIQHLIKREGNVEYSYLDSLGKLTGGVGHLLNKEEQYIYPEGTYIPEDVRNAWFEEDLNTAMKAANQQLHDLNLISMDFRDALVSVNFQLGTKWWKKFPNAYNAIKQRNWTRAIYEINHGAGGSPSLWKRQTPQRVKDFERALKKLAGRL